MRSYKRNMTHRAFTKGYKFGRSGRPKEGCPHTALAQRQAWLNGWRTGWEDRIEGNKFSGLLESFSGHLQKEYLSHLQKQ